MNSFNFRCSVSVPAIRISVLLFVTLIAVFMIGNLHSQVFKVNQSEILINTLLFSSLDLYNSIYIDKNVSSLTDIELNSLNTKDINFLDKSIVRKYRQEYDKTGNYLTIGLLGSVVYFSVWDDPFLWDNVMVLSEIMLIQYTTARWTKSLSLRTRPYAYHIETDIAKKQDKDARLSFYSLHSSTAFSIAVYNHFYQINSPGHNHFSIWLNYTLATTVSLTRVAAGEHFITDVLAGAAAGSLISYLMCNFRYSGRRASTYYNPSAYSLDIRADYIGLTVNY